LTSDALGHHHTSIFLSFSKSASLRRTPPAAVVLNRVCLRGVWRAARRGPPLVHRSCTYSAPAVNISSQRFQQGTLQRCCPAPRASRDPMRNRKLSKGPREGGGARTEAKRSMEAVEGVGAVRADFFNLLPYLRPPPPPYSEFIHAPFVFWPGGVRISHGGSCPDAMASLTGSFRISPRPRAPIFLRREGDRRLMLPLAVRCLIIWNGLKRSKLWR
jgi:hypothetical protein